MTAMLEVNAVLRQGEFLLDASFSVPTNAITALFGPSGGGKSSLLAAIAGLKRLSDGWIILNGKIRDNVSSAVHVRPDERGIGLVFQDARLFPHMTVRQNIDYARCRAPRPLRYDLIEVARLFDIGNLLGRSVNKLSGGEKGRVALARAVLSEPEFLLLDEPFAALDGTRRQHFIEILLTMHKTFGLPMMIVTHDIDDVAALASHVVGLENGRIVASGFLGDVAHLPEFQGLLDSRDVGTALSPGVLRAARAGNAQGLWLRADHIVLAGTRPVSISARNVIEGRVLSIRADPNRGVLVELQTDAGILLSRITEDAANELKLAADSPVWTIIKVHAF
jgi:molybdate transport system ATP-binding protein